MIINKKINRTMFESKSLYIGSLVLIIISCLLYTMFNQLTSNMDYLTSSFEKKYVQEDASFIADKKIDNIESLESKFNMLIEETKYVDYTINDDKILRIFSENKKVNIPAVIEGKSLKGGDILLDPAFAKANKLKIGDNIDIYGKAFKIAGYMSLPNYIYPLKTENDILNDPNRFGIAAINKNDFDNLNNGSSFYAVKFNGDKNSLDDYIAQFKDYLKSQNIIILKWTNIDENPRVTYVDLKVQGINKVSSVAPLFILLLTCILIGVVMWRMLKMEFVMIGTLYAFGYRKNEIMRHYIIYPLSIALFGGIIGTFIGGVLLRPMLNFMVSYFNIPVESVNFNIKYVVISLLLPLLFLGICGYFVIYRALRNSPIDLMRGGNEKGKVNFIERKLKLNRFKFSTKFKLREQLRSIPRSIFLLFGTAFATMLLLLGFASKCSIDYMVRDTFENTYKYQYQYVFNSLKYGEPSNGEAFSISPFELKLNKKIGFTVCGINPVSKYITLKDKSGNTLNKDSIIITRPLADKLNVKPHDTIQTVNKLDSREYSITVDYIAETYAGEYIYMPIQKFNNMLGYPSDSYTGLWSTEKLNFPESSLLSTATSEDFKKALDSVMEPLRTAVGTMAFMSFIIGLVVVYVVTSLIIEENRGSISLMKIFGYRKKEVNSLILNSSTFLVVLGYVLGVPLIIVSLKELFKSVTESINFAFPVTIEYQYVILGFVVIYLTFELSKALSRRKINRIPMSEALKLTNE